MLYTINTGTVRSHGMKVPVIEALGHARIDPARAAEGGTHAVVTERIGPRIVPLGGLSAMQGGTVVKVSSPGRQPYDVYSVFTGESGWLGSAVLPFISVDMRSVTKVQAPELPNNPPPFKPSMARLEQILTSLRWRPTDPPMREFSADSKD